MKLLSKLTLLSLGISAVPLAISGYSSLSIGQRAMRHAIEEHELTLARQVGEYASSHLANHISTLRVDARIFDLTRFDSPQGVPKFLQLAYHQSDDFCATALFDEHGQPVGQPAFMTDPERFESFRNHEPMRATDVESLGLMAPLGEALRTGQGVGPVFLGGPNRIPHVIIAVAFDPTLGGGRRVLAAEVSLRRLAEYVASLSGADTNVKLVDDHGRLIASGRGGIAALEPQDLPGAANARLPDREQVTEYTSGGRAVIGAYTPALPFGIVVEKTLDAALRPVERIRLATLYWIGIAGVVGALAAWMFARRLSQRIGALAAGSKQIARGRLESVLEVEARDELGDLAAAFNAMATSLETAREEILRQNDEIRAWNATLEKRVEEKTSELRQAQDLLLRSRALVAVGELGSGVAHEINNPLAGVLGLAQLMLADLPEDHPLRPLIKDIEDQALRIRKIVNNLLRLAQREGREDFEPIDLTHVVDDAVELCSPAELASAKVQLERRFVPPIPRLRGSAPQLQQAFIQLIVNAREACPDGGRICIEVSAPGGELVRVTVSDNGRGIAAEHLPRIFDPFFTTKTARRGAGTGMGLSLVHKIVDDHGGAIRVDSEPERGTTVTITLPVQTAAVQLQ